MAQIAVDLANSFKAVGVSSVYGDVVDLDGTRIVPVAVSTYGFGAGDGDAATDVKGDSRAGGSGGGGYGFGAPVGAYIKEGGRVRFEPNLVSLLAVGIPFVWVAGKALSGIIRALKK